MKHISGYFLGIDFGNRDMLDNCIKPDGSDWTLMKGADSFAAVSDFVDKSEVEAWDNMELELKVNGKLRQSSNTQKMIFGVPKLIADISKYMMLHEGDLIYTGTPEGAGMITDGDEVYAHLKRPGSNDNLLEINIKV